MISGSHKNSCCCGNCDCVEDCNGYWGTPNQDRAYQCCWSVGDRVQYTHNTITDYVYKGGGITPQTVDCRPQSYTCGLIRRKSNILVEVEYVCIAAKGNFHKGSGIDSEYQNLPEYIDPKQWDEDQPTASPTGDGWNIAPIVYLPKEDPFRNPAPAIPKFEGDTWDYGEYVQNPAHRPGCVQGLPYKYENKFDGFVGVIGEGGGLEWEPRPKDADWEINLDNTDTSDDFKIGTLQTGCRCIGCVMQEKDVIICGAGTYLDCENEGDENTPPTDCKLADSDPTDSGSPCACGNTLYNSDVPPFVCRNFECEYCLHPDTCQRINKCNPDSDCSCFKASYLKEVDLSPTTNEVYEVDTEGYVLDTNGERIFAGYEGRYEHKIFQSATIFALDLTNPDIQYCRGEYWIEEQVGTDDGVKYQKYKLQPFLVLLNRPILEWDCDCKDSNGNYYLPEGLGKYKRRKVYGGFKWKLWDGNCAQPNCELYSVRDPFICVDECELVEKRFAAEGGQDVVPPCRKSVPINPLDPPFYDFFESITTLESQSTADFFRCVNCVEAVASCGGFKGYCVKRRNVTPNEPKSCPGECRGFYGTMNRKSDYDCENAGEPKEPVLFACEYGCAESDVCQGTCENHYINEIGALDQSGNPIFVLTPSPYQRSECVAYSTHTLTILPVDQEKRRCLWNEFVGRNFEGELESFGCCGIYPYHYSSTDGPPVGKDVGTPVDVSNPHGDLGFSWTEGYGWKSTCEDIGDIFEDLLTTDGDDELSGGIEACDENGQNCEPIGNPDTTCDVDPSFCNDIQCSDITAFISASDIINGKYPCLLATTSRPCCKLPFELICQAQWPYYTTGPQYTYGSEQYWNSQQLAGNQLPIVTGCSCLPPSCECYTGNIIIGYEPTPGRYDEITDFGRCDSDNYSRLSSFRNCITGCKDYVADLYGCKYNPTNRVGTSTDDCVLPPCYENGTGHSYPYGCDNGDGIIRCPIYCICTGQGGQSSEGWECVGDCSELSDSDTGFTCTQGTPKQP